MTPSKSPGLKVATKAQACAHGNVCLDGNPIPVLVQQVLPSRAPSRDSPTPDPIAKRFQRAAIARLGLRKAIRSTVVQYTSGPARTEKQDLPRSGAPEQ